MSQICRVRYAITTYPQVPIKDASYGKVLYEKEPGEFTAFQKKANQFEQQVKNEQATNELNL